MLRIQVDQILSRGKGYLRLEALKQAQEKGRVFCILKEKNNTLCLSDSKEYNAFKMSISKGGKRRSEFWDLGGVQGS